MFVEVVCEDLYEPRGRKSNGRKMITVIQNEKGGGNEVNATKIRVYQLIYVKSQSTGLFVLGVTKKNRYIRTASFN